MDGHRFDELTKALAAGTSRRGLLRGMAAGLGAALLGRSAARAEDGCPVPLDLGEPCAAKVAICHRTGSATNPVRHIRVCESAVPAHAAHGDLVACPLPKQVIDPETCTCVCDPTITCDVDEFLNPATCECECIAVTCPPGQQQNQNTCECECTPVECPGGQVQDPTTCLCGCPEVTCPTGQVQDPFTCECIDEAFFCENVFMCGNPIITCGPEGSECLCGPSVEGAHVCGNNFFCDETVTCTATEQCAALFGEGFTCRTEGFGCCPGSPGVCRPPCGEAFPTSTSVSTGGPRLTDAGIIE